MAQFVSQHVCYLNKDELDYELRIRGISDKESNVEGMRKHFRSLLALEKAGSSLDIKYDLDVKTEITECTRKLEELKTLVESFTGSTNQSKKIDAKLAHMTARIGRIPGEEESSAGERSKLLLTLFEIVPVYQNKAKLFDKKDDNLPLDPHFSNPAPTQNISTPTAQTSTSFILNETSSPNMNIQNATIHTPTNNNVSNKPVAIYKWNLKFSGSSDMSFNSFLQRVEELSRSRQVSKSDLFLSAHDLFEGDALNFYHMVVKYANDWDSLIALMKEQFVPAHVADQLWKQILSRTQGPEESIGLYVAAMSKLFDRMPTVIDDQLRLKVLKSNILPFYQERLTLQSINSPFDLIELCRKLEETKINIENYMPPKSGNLTLEPDLDYHSSRKSKPLVVREMCVSPAGSSSNTTNNHKDRTPRFCFKCDQPNHLAKHCTSGIVRCYSCKKIGFTKKSCPDCSKNGQGNARRGQF